MWFIKCFGCFFRVVDNRLPSRNLPRTTGDDSGRIMNWGPSRRPSDSPANIPHDQTAIVGTSLLPPVELNLEVFLALVLGHNPIILQDSLFLLDLDLDQYSSTLASCLYDFSTTGVTFMFPENQSKTTKKRNLGMG